MTRHRRLLVVAVTVGVAVAVTATGSAATTDEGARGQNVLRQQLSGYAETPLAVSTPAGGRFRAQLRGQEVTWELSYSNLEGVTQAHVHFGSPAQSGGVSVFLCTNLGNGPAGTQACPAAPATISGTITATDVIGPAAQGIAAGEFEELVRAARAGLTYVNVHTAAFPAGEIRGQLGHHR